jgi:hypothetical protein
MAAREVAPAELLWRVKIADSVSLILSGGTSDAPEEAEREIPADALTLAERLADAELERREATAEAARKLEGATGQNEAGAQALLEAGEAAGKLEDANGQGEAAGKPAGGALEETAQGLNGKTDEKAAGAAEEAVALEAA